jgi:tetratricopeptide (TPR) repeat protein
MATLCGFLMYVRSTETTGAGRIAWLVGLGTVTTAGVYSKENAVMITGVIALYELAWLGRRRWFDFLFGCVATGIPIAGMLVQRASVLARSAPAEFPFTDNPIADAGFWTGRLTALKVVAHYLVQAVWPWRLSIDYSYAQIPLVSGGTGAWILVAVALLAAAGLVGLRRWNRTAFFLAGFALIVLLPTSNLLFPIGTIRAERFLYLPAVGLLGCVVMAAYALGSRMRSPLVAPTLILVMTASFALRTWGRNTEWRDEVTLASTDVQTSPHSFKLHLLLATAMFSADPLHANIDRVVEETDKSLAILNGLSDLRIAPETYYFAGVAYFVKGDRFQTAGAGDAQTAYRRSRELLERCIQLNNAHERQRETTYGKPAPGVVARTKPDAYLQLSMAYQRLGDMAGAIRAAHEAQRLAPQDFRMYRQMADLFLMRQQGDEAAVALIEGMLITSDPSLRSDLVRLYGSSTDPANCTLLPDPNGPAINQQCPIVRDHMCAAAPDVLMALIYMGRRQEALETKQAFMSDYQCAPGPLNEVLP